MSQSELSILRALASGATYRRIANELYLSPATVSYHVGRLQARFKVPNNVALVALAIVTGVLTSDTWPPSLTGVTTIDDGFIGPE